MLILISDLETTGLNAENDDAVEIAALLYDTSTCETIAATSHLIPSFPDKEGISYSGINISSTYTIPFSLGEFERLLTFADAVAGHNFLGFDMQFFKHKNYLPDIDKPVIDTMLIDWPKGRKGRNKLELLAIDHEIPVFRSHRALADCQLIAGIFSRYSAEELETLFSKALEPKQLYLSLEGKPGTLSKQFGFKFNSQIPGKWARFMTDEEFSKCPIPVALVKV